MKINFDQKFKGVSFDKKTKQWRARITAGDTRIFLGRFEKREHAIVARKTAEKILS